MLEAVVFDMDGVLIDSEYTFLESKTEILQEAGHPMDISYQYQFMGTTFDYMWRQMKEELGLPLEIADYIQLMNDKRQQMMTRDGIRPIKGVVSFIQQLSQQTTLRLAVASSSPRMEILHAVEALGLSGCFQVLVSGEEVQHSKPAPDVFLEAAKRLAVNPVNCIAFEDTKNGSRSAAAAGMVCIGFENPDYPPQDLSSAQTVITDFSSIDETFLAAQMRQRNN